MQGGKKLTVDFPQFDEGDYLAANEDVRLAVQAGSVASGYDHFLAVGFDENRSPRLRREPTTLQGGIEKCFVSEAGYFLVLGWLADEGRGPPRCRFLGTGFTIDVSAGAVFRHARKDVESIVREGAYDYGLVIFGQALATSILKQPVLLQVTYAGATFQGRTAPEVVADKRLLDTVLIMLKTAQSHAGKEGNLYGLLSSEAGRSLVDLFRLHVSKGTKGHFVRRFRPRAVKRTFVTVLFGSTDAMLVQPFLFQQQGIDFGEWIYVCNSPEDAAAALRLGRMMSDVYDVMITVVIMSDNVGFGAANNVAVSHASSNEIFIINPDVYPLAAHAEILRKSLDERDLGSSLWGGLLFYDDYNLMHAGMYMEQDEYFRCRSFNPLAGELSATAVQLVRVEHFDKGVPFEEGRWKFPTIVPAITGAVMAFSRQYFEKIGGFSTRYIYGHYEDADLSIRWAEQHGPVIVDPWLRLVHLEGQGSRARGEQYGGAAMVNRYFFSLQHASTFEEQPERFVQRIVIE